MYSVFTDFLLWLPGPLYILALGVLAIFLIVTLLRIVAFILDLIPFL